MPPRPRRRRWTSWPRRPRKRPTRPRRPPTRPPARSRTASTDVREQRGPRTGHRAGPLAYPVNSRRFTKP
ncbi:MAG: hypothetical protein EOL89_01715 [Actinobacteria bacterium]|nr:hypothetical protein [Actinomycetota bacterium]